MPWPMDCDNEFVVNALNGHAAIHRLSNLHLFMADIMEHVVDLVVEQEKQPLASNGGWISWTPREANAGADALGNFALAVGKDFELVKADMDIMDPVQQGRQGC